jgi:hypothetical protein
MMIRQIVIAMAGAAGVAGCGLLAIAAEPPAKTQDLRSKVAFFMHAKLTNSQSVLEGLTTEQFDLIQQGAERMIVMSKAAEWRVGQGDIYAQDTAQFVAAARDLVKQAKARNLDGATVSYLQLTMNCVSCHKHIREEKSVGLVIPQRRAKPRP